ncbi:hypothetical protein JW721_04050 [Candidatus Micrarchaeota archaeon]|nr:hypothetical protein [Candidatus Micrarchaeota archaeon]
MAQDDAGLQDSIFPNFRYPRMWDSLIARRLREKGFKRAEYMRSLLRRDLLGKE